MSTFSRIVLLLMGIVATAACGATEPVGQSSDDEENVGETHAELLLPIILPCDGTFSIPACRNRWIGFACPLPDGTTGQCGSYTWPWVKRGFDCNICVAPPPPPPAGDGSGGDGSAGGSGGAGGSGDATGSASNGGSAGGIDVQNTP